MKWRTTSAPTAPVEPAVDWRRARFCIVDVETTGLDLRRDEIVSIGSVAIVDGRVACDSESYTVVKSKRQPCIEAIQVHYLRPADVMHGADSGEVAQILCAELSGSILVAHAAWIEKSFLGRMLGQAGLALTAPIIDTAALARAVGLGATNPLHDPSLEYLATRLGLPVYTPHHALGDAMTTAIVFLALVGKCEVGASSTRLTVDHLLALSAQHSR